ncbi:MAG: hypothetical protein QW452_09970 [Pyrobaculum sp.]
MCVKSGIWAYIYNYGGLNSVKSWVDIVEDVRKPVFNGVGVA